MEHTQQARQAGQDAPAATAVARPDAPRSVSVFAATLCATALGAAGVLCWVGAQPPRPGPILLLALAAALCVNRFALFPSEHAATAEAAVLLAAVVGFRDDAVFLGPLLVAILVGPLDALHWKQRSFVRMAYNSGNRGLAVLAASSAFVGARDFLDHSPLAWAVLLLTAASAFVVVDLFLSMVLLQLFGQRSVLALRHLVEVDALTLPVAWYGAAAALVVGGAGWWAIALALVPVAYVPELVIARARRHAHFVRDLVALLAVVAVVAVVAVGTSVADEAALALLVGIAVLAGLELVVERGARFAPLSALVVVAATVVVDRGDARAAAVIVAVAVVATQWCVAPDHDRSRVRLLAGVAFASGAALLAATLATATPRTVTGLALGALAAGFGFEGIAVLSGSRRRTRVVTAVWNAPLVATAVAWAITWRSVGSAGGVLFAAAVAATLAVIGWWAAPTWRSRVLQPALRDRAAGPVMAVLVGGATTATVAAIVAVTRTDHAVAVTWGWVSVGLGESVTAAVAIGVHQWRFAPRARAVALGTLLGVSALLLFGVSHVLVEGDVAGVVSIAALMVGVLLLARRPARLARDSSPVPGGGARSRARARARVPRG